MAAVQESSSRYEEENDEGETVEDYVKYEIGDVSVEPESVSSFPINAFEFPYAKVYIVYTSSNEVTYGYRLYAESYIPACTLYVYSDNIHLGSSMFKEARSDEERIVPVGQSSKVKCENSITYFDSDKQDRIDKNTVKTYNTEVVKCEIMNYNADSAIVLVRHPLRTRNIESISVEPTRVKEGILEWEFEIGPRYDKSDFFEYTITYYEIIRTQTHEMLGSEENIGD
jgi:hypothetical protein